VAYTVLHVLLAPVRAVAYGPAASGAGGAPPQAKSQPDGDLVRLTFPQASECEQQVFNSSSALHDVATNPLAKTLHK